MKIIKYLIRIKKLFNEEKNQTNQSIEFVLMAIEDFQSFFIEISFIYQQYIGFLYLKRLFQNFLMTDSNLIYFHLHNDTNNNNNDDNNNNNVNNKSDDNNNNNNDNKNDNNDNNNKNNINNNNNNVINNNNSNLDLNFIENKNFVQYIFKIISTPQLNLPSLFNHYYFLIYSKDKKQSNNDTEISHYVEKIKKLIICENNGSHSNNINNLENNDNNDKNMIKKNKNDNNSNQKKKKKSYYRVLRDLKNKK
jgi:hypothetical protein